MTDSATIPHACAALSEAPADAPADALTAHGVRVTCPAKTNLTLLVSTTRSERGNRHALDTVYCGLELHDTVTLEPTAPGTGLDLRIGGDYFGPRLDEHPLPGTAPFESNHVIRAAHMLAESLGVPADVRITIDKRIPVAAGLGGGSADAAGTLVGLAALWHDHYGAHAALRPTRTELERIAATIGADVPFCLDAGLAHGTGYGERVEAIPEGSAAWRAWQPRLGCMLIGMFRDGLSTADVYRRFDEIGGAERNASPSNPAMPDPNDPATPRIINDLQPAAIDLHPRSGTAIELAHRMGAEAFVSGSGPTVIALCPSAATRSELQRLWAAEHAVDGMATSDGAPKSLGLVRFAR